MNINLSEKLAEHFERIEAMSIEASDDLEEKYSSRASAMSAMTTMLRDLERIQQKVINMERLAIVEQVTIEVLKEHLPANQHDKFLSTLEQRISDAIGETE